MIDEIALRGLSFDEIDDLLKDIDKESQENNNNNRSTKNALKSVENNLNGLAGIKFGNVIQNTDKNIIEKLKNINGITVKCFLDNSREIIVCNALLNKPHQESEIVTLNERIEDSKEIVETAKKQMDGITYNQINTILDKAKTVNLIRENMSLENILDSIKEERKESEKAGLLIGLLDANKELRELFKRVRDNCNDNILGQKKEMREKLIQLLYDVDNHIIDCNRINMNKNKINGADEITENDEDYNEIIKVLILLYYYIEY